MKEQGVIKNAGFQRDFEYKFADLFWTFLDFSFTNDVRRSNTDTTVFDMT